MKRLTGMLTALMILFAVGTFYAQQHAEHGGASAKAGDAKSVPEVFCDHMGTGQLCAGNAQMFNLSGTQKERYVEAVKAYNAAMAAASKQFVADAKAKVGLEPAQLAVIEKWFATGLNPEINKILATTTKK